jgi:hypothetical protein
MLTTGNKTTPHWTLKFKCLGVDHFDYPQNQMPDDELDERERILLARVSLTTANGEKEVFEVIYTKILRCRTIS